MNNEFMDMYDKAAKCRRRVNAERFEFAAPAVSDAQDKFAQDVANTELDVICLLGERGLRALWNMDKADVYMRDGLDAVCDWVCDYEGNVLREDARDFLAGYCKDCTPAEVIGRRGRNFAEAVLEAMQGLATARREAAEAQAEAVGA